MSLVINNYNKKPLGNDNQALEANVNKFAS